ncbi:MAG: sulfatase-like hydrolase/transferase [Bacteroidia bacterium]
MKKLSFKVPYVVWLLVFWLLFFALYRLAFIIYHHTKIPNDFHSETGLSFFYALRLDLSAACAAAFIPYLLWSVQQFYKRRSIHLANKVYNLVCISLVSVLSLANLKIYGEWGTLLSARAFNYLLYPQEVLTFISFWSLLLLLAVCAVFIYLAVKLYRSFVTGFSYPVENRRLKIAQVAILPFLLVVGYRGGLQLTPINESSAYYSSLQINNHIATNNMWYLVHSIVEANDKKNPYVFMDKEKAKDIRNMLFAGSSGTKQPFLNTTKPNIVLIILESWTADIIKALDGEQNVTPYFDELRKDGLLFTQMYGSGFRTEQGLVSILSGFPAQPNNTIIATPSKAERLPSLNTELSKLGYQSSFYYGGDIEFANMKSYLLNSHIGKIIDKNNFDKSEQNSKWGAHDEFVLKKQLNGLKDEKQPFFSIVLTLSTHEPFEVPMQTPFRGGEEQERFKKAAYYTDYCLQNYFKEARQQPWYNNTLFILVADHGHHLPKGRNMDLPESRRITALFTGGALVEQVRGSTMDKIVNQNDLPATLLSALEQPHSQFGWSRDMFNAGSEEFAYYSNENVFGWIAPQQNLVYFFGSKNVDIQAKTQSIVNDTVLTQGQAYLQCLYDEYLNY